MLALHRDTSSDALNRRCLNATTLPARRVVGPPPDGIRRRQPHVRWNMTYLSPTPVTSFYPAPCGTTTINEPGSFAARHGQQNFSVKLIGACDTTTSSFVGTNGRHSFSNSDSSSRAGAATEWRVITHGIGRYRDVARPLIPQRSAHLMVR